MKHRIHTRSSIAVFLAMPLFLAACATPPPRAVNSPEAEATEDFIQNYYRTPDPARAIDLLPAFVQWVGEKPESLSWPMGGFYAGVVATSPERHGEWTAIHDDSDTPGWLKYAIDIGRSTPEERTEVFDAYSSDMAPERLDFFWGWFFATGNPDAPRRVIRRGGIVDPPYASLDLTAGAAQWSVRSIARQHSVVKDELNAYVRTATADELRNYFGRVACMDEYEDILAPDAIALIFECLSSREAEGTP